MIRFIAYALLILCAILAKRVFRFFHVPHHPSEPPLLAQPFPLLGHLFGMLRHGSYYYSIVSKYTQAPIFTLRVPGAKIYVVKSPRLASQVDRNPKDISFSPYAVIFAERILMSSTKGLKALRVNLYEEGCWGCLSETRKVMHDTMSPGNDLEILAKDIAKNMWPHLSSLDAIPNTGRVRLHEWLSHLICQSTSDAVWGPKNPFKDPAVEKGFWAIKEQFAYLGLNFFPSVTARKGFYGREDLFNGFRKYYAENGQEDASPLVQARFKVNKKYDISMDDIAKYDLSVCLGVLINSTVSAFWCLYDLYSRPELLEEVRRGISDAVGSSSSTNGPVHVDIEEVSTQYLKLEAIVREILRRKAFNVSGRVILNDTALDGGYLLKKDSLLLVPSAELHENSEVWGKSAKEFDPDRFLRGSGFGAGVPASSHRTFGGGSSLCPGRHIFMKEVMVLLIIMVLRYDVRPVSGKWEDIEGRAHISASILAPTKDVEVMVYERKGGEEARWKFFWAGTELGESP
ncbi:cytochrome P450 [Lindgomyces ingoldianus]|uniref:Cytochrome P450 n=1 Tax=Lindgomyces ingoldianus TaxID=673940 RepID=A0ACB6QW07_9PLEO|nr:cytochrome P450 [Lindgomyces ingoldianus]KAF2470376.1 cytochrome P450 [Lindgomyces ingoldianus]